MLTSSTMRDVRRVQTFELGAAEILLDILISMVACTVLPPILLAAAPVGAVINNSSRRCNKKTLFQLL